MKKYKKQLILSSIVILLPIVFGLIMWDRLPESFATHWGVDGQADSWMDKGLAIFLLPVLMLGMNFFCAWITEITNRGNDQSPKVMNLVFCLIPAISLMSNGMVYAIAMGKVWDMTSMMPILMGLMFVVIGNYLPKCTRNSTVGIKVKWTLSNDENWNATHRFAGKTWVAGGVISVFSALLPTKIGYPIMMVAILGAGFGSMFYSWLYYRKQLKAGTAATDTELPMDKTTKVVARVGLVVGILILIFCGVLLFSGSIQYEFQDDALMMDASFYSPIRLPYGEIDTIEYREGDLPGIRTNGFASTTLLLGYFENEEFGTYSRYTYTKAESCIIVTCKGDILVISGKTAAETREIYDTLLERMK